MTLRTLNYGNYGIFLIMGNAGFCPSTVSRVISTLKHAPLLRLEDKELVKEKKGMQLERPMQPAQHEYITCPPDGRKG